MHQIAVQVTKMTVNELNKDEESDLVAFIVSMADFVYAEDALKAALVKLYNSITKSSLTYYYCLSDLLKYMSLNLKEKPGNYTIDCLERIAELTPPIKKLKGPLVNALEIIHFRANNHPW